MQFRPISTPGYSNRPPSSKKEYLTQYFPKSYKGESYIYSLHADVLFVCLL